MKNVIIFLLCINSFILGAVTKKNDIDYQRDRALKIAETIGAGIGGTLTSPGLIVTVPIFLGIHERLDRFRPAVYYETALDRAFFKAAFSPVTFGVGQGKKLFRPIAISLLAGRYNLPRHAIILSIKFGLTLSIYHDFLRAVIAKNNNEISQKLKDEMYLFFGAYWKTEFPKMLEAFEHVLSILESHNIPHTHKNIAMLATPFYQNYNQTQIKFFALMVRLLLVVYQLYYQQDLPIAKDQTMPLDQFIALKRSWIEPIKVIFNKFLKNN